MLELTIDGQISGLAIALVEARGLRIGESPAALKDYCAEVARRVASAGLAGGEGRRSAVRELLRRGGFKPAGRSKPAQEYLLRSVTEQGHLPSIFNAVDLINAVSLDCGLPISLLSAERLGEHVTVRHGRPGERYVFNRAGQELDLAGLICICRGVGDQSTAMGSPIKDSLHAKISENDCHVLACIYVPADATSADEVETWVSKLVEGFECWCDAQALETRLLGLPSSGF
jgi:DNA/RNA-binding domain of Phe-tRNA-synthetase-like protein